MSRSRTYAGFVGIVGLLFVACAAGEHVSEQAPPSIEGRIEYLSLGATGGGGVGGEMKLVTAQGDTFLLFAPGAVRCAPGTTGEVVGYGGGTMMRVYLKPKNLQLARKKYVPVEWAEVECIRRRP